MTEEVLQKVKFIDRSYMKTEAYRKKMSECKKGKTTSMKGVRGSQKNSIQVETPYGIFSSLREASDFIGVKCCTTIKRWALSGKEGYRLIF